MNSEGGLLNDTRGLTFWQRFARLLPFSSALVASSSRAEREPAISHAAEL
jgi:hypothetical protein